MRHYMHLKESPFQKIKEGKKTIELRLYDGKRQLIKTGDEIEFTSAEDESGVIIARVKQLHVFGDFAELYKTLPLTLCGYSADEAENADPADMLAYYSAEEQARYGVVGVEIEVM